MQPVTQTVSSQAHHTQLWKVGFVSGSPCSLPRPVGLYAALAASFPRLAELHALVKRSREEGKEARSGAACCSGCHDEQRMTSPQLARFSLLYFLIAPSCRVALLTLARGELCARTARSNGACIASQAMPATQRSRLATQSEHVRHHVRAQAPKLAYTACDRSDRPTVKQR